jgi:hypothetical protein
MTDLFPHVSGKTETPATAKAIADRACPGPASRRQADVRNQGSAVVHHDRAVWNFPR